MKKKRVGRGWKLNRKMAGEIRIWHQKGFSIRQLAYGYQVTYNAIWMIVNGYSYK